MNKATQRTITYLGLFASLIICSFLVNDINKTIFITLGGICLLISGLSVISTWFRQPLFLRILEHIDELRMGYLAIFLALYSLSLTLIQHHLIFLGLMLVLADYAVFYWWVGRLLGKDVLRPFCNKLNIFIPSMKPPKDI